MNLSSWPGASTGCAATLAAPPKITRQASRCPGRRCCPPARTASRNSVCGRTSQTARSLEADDRAFQPLTHQPITRDLGTELGDQHLPGAGVSAASLFEDPMGAQRLRELLSSRGIWVPCCHGSSEQQVFALAWLG